MKFTIDRFEEEFAVIELENRDMLNIPSILLPEDSKEGDVLKIIIDEDETHIRRRRIEEKFKRLYED